MPLVSIIMNCYNGSKFLREAIDSVYAQTFKDWEIIFWDNQSRDNSAEIAKSYDDKIKYFRAEEFLPVGGARNKAIKKATGEYIAFLDTDDIWYPTHLESHTKAFQEDTIVVYGNFVIKDMAAGKDYVPFNPSREFHSGNITAKLCKKNFIWLQAILMKTSFVGKLEYSFDTELLTAEDYDLILRLSQVGNFNYVAEPTFVYRIHESNLTSSKKHYFAHDFSYLLQKYKGKLTASEYRDLARQYMMAVRLDLNAAGFGAFPFMRLGFSFRQILISLAFAVFPGMDIWELKEKLTKPFKFIDTLTGRK